MSSERAELKIILLGDSASGKTKLMERFLLDKYNARQLSTYAVNIFSSNVESGGRSWKVDFWDTAGQEMFDSLHPSYYYDADCCILSFDVTRKITYKNL
jgi:Rab-like protein 2